MSFRLVRHPAFHISLLPPYWEYGSVQPPLPPTALLAGDMDNEVKLITQLRFRGQTPNASIDSRGVRIICPDNSLRL